MPGYPTPNSGGNAQPENTTGGVLPSGKPGGEITISRRETKALLALEGEDDDRLGARRASSESGLSEDQLRRLKARAEGLRSKGYTLKGQTAIFKPTNYDGDDEALLGKKELARDSRVEARKKQLGASKGSKTRPSTPAGFSARPATRPTASATREAQALWTRLHECDGDGECGPCRQKRLAREASAKRKRRGGSC